MCICPKTELTQEDYGFQIRDYSIPFLLPRGYQPAKTVELENKLYPNKKYRVGFWVTASKSPKWAAYSYYLWVFPGNFMETTTDEDRKLSTSDDMFPKVDVPRIQHSETEYLSYVVSPDTIYSHLTIGIREGPDAFPNMSDYVKISGIFVEPLLDKDGSVNERELIDKGESYTVTEKTATIYVYDHKKIDNDIVTIYLNDTILVDKLTLKRRKKKFKAKLQPGVNTIRLHANNLGEIGSNTAAILIKSGEQKIEQVLSSNLNQSEYFTLIYKEK